jgi:small-conductance mechanosensitive channel
MPIFMSVLMVGLFMTSQRIDMSDGARFTVRASMATLAVIFWSGAAFRVGHALLEVVSARSAEGSMIQRRTLPIFDMTMKVAVVTAALYFTFLAWDIDLTAWLASAGVLGIAVGFAAKDTLANLFAGIFIVADGPYKVGDYIVLDGELRGEVSHIGVRSTRVLTRDDVEITIPNAVIANAKIVNESGGPYVKQRVAVTVDAAYGSDVDLVRQVLLDCVPGVEHVCETPHPQVRFREFGGSGLRHELLVWIDQPAMRGMILDALHVRVYKAFAQAGIEIPYSKHDVYIKELAERAS